VEQPVRVLAGPAVLDGDLATPAAPQGVVLFAHGSGSGRHSPRNRYVAGELQKAGLATVLADLLTPQEEQVDAQTGALRFDISLLGERLVALTDWLVTQERTADLGVGLFGASTAAAGDRTSRAGCSAWSASPSC
jgi:dienelactone hydrolase